MSEIVVEAVKDNTEASTRPNIIAAAVTEDINEEQTTSNVTLGNNHGNPAGLTIVTEPSEEDTATTITEPYITKKISKRYFLNVDQRINKEARDKNPEWQDLKKNVGLLIDGELKEKMTVEAQHIGLKIFHVGGESLVQNFSEIGKVWKHDNSVEIATKINRVLHGQFTEVDGYEYDIERDVMKKMRLEYKDDSRGKACIAMMVVRRRSELAKTTMKRSWTTHEAKIVTKRTKKEVEEEGIRKPKVKESFRIQTNINSVWYSKDGSTYSQDKTVTKCISEHEHLRKRIIELEEVIAQKEKVYKSSFIKFYLNIYASLNNCFLS